MKTIPSRIPVLYNGSNDFCIIDVISPGEIPNISATLQVGETKFVSAFHFDGKWWQDWALNYPGFLPLPEEVKNQVLRYFNEKLLPE